MSRNPFGAKVLYARFPNFRLNDENDPPQVVVQAPKDPLPRFLQEEIE